MVCVDRLSKMVRLIPCNKTISSEAAAKKYRDFVWKDFGLTSRIISDRGLTFVSNFTRVLNSLLGIMENFSTARRPQTDGQTERANQEIEQYLRIFCNLVLLDARGLNMTCPSKKLDDKRHGPFPVTECVGLQSYRLQLPTSWKI